MRTAHKSPPMTIPEYMLLHPRLCVGQVAYAYGLTPSRVICGMLLQVRLQVRAARRVASAALIRAAA